MIITELRFTDGVVVITARVKNTSTVNEPREKNSPDGRNRFSDVRGVDYGNKRSP